MKTLALLSALWFALTPALCVAGALTHACDCPPDAAACLDCSHDNDASVEAAHLGCECADTGCSHDGCESDPCVPGLLPREDGSSIWLTPLQPGWTPFDELAHLAARPPPGERPAALLPTPTIPFFRSDIPLLS